MSNLLCAKLRIILRKQGRNFPTKLPHHFPVGIAVFDPTPFTPDMSLFEQQDWSYSPYGCEGLVEELPKAALSFTCTSIHLLHQHSFHLSFPSCAKSASAPALFTFGKTGSQHLANWCIYFHSIMSLRPCHHIMPYILSMRPYHHTMPYLAASAHLHHLHLDLP